MGGLGEKVVKLLIGLDFGSIAKNVNLFRTCINLLVETMESLRAVWIELVVAPSWQLSEVGACGKT